MPEKSLQNMVYRAAASDKAAFGELYHHFHLRLKQFAYTIAKTNEAAEEIVEDVFIKIWKQREHLPEIGNLTVYLYTAIKNTALNYLARIAKENITEPFDHLDVELFVDTRSPDQIMITAEIYSHIQQAVESLPPRCKMIFKLIREDGLKYKEVSEILHISVNTIDAQMAIAVKRITDSVRKDFGNTSSLRLFLKK